MVKNQRGLAVAPTSLCVHYPAAESSTSSGAAPANPTELILQLAVIQQR